MVSHLGTLALTDGQPNDAPLYWKIRTHIWSQIESGIVGIGDKLPSERSLAATFGVSLMTARQAMNQLEREGKVERRPGVGTFASSPGIQLIPPLSFTQSPPAMGIIDVQHYAITNGRYLGGGLNAHSPAMFEDLTKRAHQMIQNIQELQKAFRSTHRRVFFTRHGLQLPEGDDLVARRRLRERHCLESTHGKFRHLAFKDDPEYQIIPEVAPLNGELVLDKNTSSAFNSTPIDLFLRNMGIGMLFLAGVASEQCVFATALDAADRGFHVIIVADACTSLDPECAEVVHTLFSHVWGHVMQTANVINWLKTGKIQELALSKRKVNIAL